MKIIPSLDLQNACSKYAYRGERDAVVIIKNLMHYGLHTFLITDLDGVFSGSFKNYDIIESIKTLGVQIIASGGIRSLSVAELLFEKGVAALVLGSAAIKDQELLVDLISKYPDKIYVALDTFEDSVYIEGWLEETDVSADEFVQSMNLLGVNRFIHSHVNKKDDLTTCTGSILLSKYNHDHNIILPAIDLERPLGMDRLKVCLSDTIVIGGCLDQFNWEDYKQKHL